MPTTSFDKDSIKASIIGKLQRYNGRTIEEASNGQIYRALASTVRDRLRGLGELHRAADPVVVGQREGLVPVRGRGDGELLGQRGAVQEGEGGVGVQLGVHGSNTCSHACGRKSPHDTKL